MVVVDSPLSFATVTIDPVVGVTKYLINSAKFIKNFQTLSCMFQALLFVSSICGADHILSEMSFESFSQMKLFISWQEEGQTLSDYQYNELKKLKNQYSEWILNFLTAKESDRLAKFESLVFKKQPISPPQILYYKELIAKDLNGSVKQLTSSQQYTLQLLESVHNLSVKQIEQLESLKLANSYFVKSLLNYHERGLLKSINSYIAAGNSVNQQLLDVQRGLVERDTASRLSAINGQELITLNYFNSCVTQGYPPLTEEHKPLHKDKKMRSFYFGNKTC
jgi:hypothetical protein